LYSGVFLSGLNRILLQLLAHRLRALATGQFLGQAVICSATAFSFDGVQRQLKNISRCLLKRPLPVASGAAG
jgi:hypothetical protein